MIYAVDFDGTIYKKGKPNVPLINYLIEKGMQGHILILDTCRTGVKLSEAVAFCKKKGLVFSYINENCPQAIQMLGSNPRKIYADIYIDDKAYNACLFC